MMKLKEIDERLKTIRSETDKLWIESTSLNEARTDALIEEMFESKLLNKSLWSVIYINDKLITLEEVDYSASKKLLKLFTPEYHEYFKSSEKDICIYFDDDDIHIQVPISNVPSFIEKSGVIIDTSSRKEQIEQTEEKLNVMKKAYSDIMNLMSNIKGEN